MPNEEFHPLQAAYRNRLGRGPPKPHRLTIEQMTAFKHILTKRDDVFVDMVVWLPSGERNLPRQKFNAMMFNSVGQLVMTECYGPLFLIMVSALPVI